MIAAVGPRDLTILAKVINASRAFADTQQLVDIVAIVALITTVGPRFRAHLAVLDSTVIILAQARVQVEVEARRARITAFFARIRARRTVVHPAVLADRVEFKNLTASTLDRIDEELHDCEQDNDQEELR